MPRLFLSYSPPGAIPRLLTLSISHVFPPDFPPSPPFVSLFRVAACSKAQDTTASLGEEYSDSFFFDRAAATSLMNSVWYVYTERFMNIAS